MPRATCRCGQVLSIPVNGPERVLCPKCGAKVRVRKDEAKEKVDGAGAGAGGEGDGFLRFDCPCGRRLKVRTGTDREPAPKAGKCPQCGRVVPVPAVSALGGSLRAKPSHPETPTEEMSEGEVITLDRWVQAHIGGGAAAELESDREPTAVAAPTFIAQIVEPEPVPAAPPEKAEAGLRVCSRCGRPLHLSAVACRECGAPAPRR